MLNSKYNNTLTIILIIVIILIILLVGFFGYKYWKESKDEEEAKSAVEEIKNNANSNNDNAGNLVDGDKPEDPVNPDSEDEPIDISGTIDNTSSNGNENSSSNNNGKKYYKGYEMVGAIEIPKTNITYPILSKNVYSKTALETSICQLYGANPNEVGNMILVGHNYKNNRFFSNNKKLNIGDKILITDLSGKTVTYTIYNKYETTENDSEYMTRDTAGKREISLSTCTDDVKLRLVIWATAD